MHFQNWGLHTYATVHVLVATPLHVSTFEEVNTGSCDTAFKSMSKRRTAGEYEELMAVNGR